VDSLQNTRLAVVNAGGDILFVNEGWRSPRRAGPLCPAELGPGDNYLQACQAVDGELAACAEQLATGIHLVVNGRRRQFQVEYPVHCSGREYWYQTRVTRFEDEDGPRAAVAHYDITSLKAAQQELAYQALHDQLTELPNRTLFDDRLRHAWLSAARDHKRLAVMILDLDRFKEINDTFGHRIGDLALREAASRIGGALRRSDTLARLGGDEFGIILPGLRAVDRPDVSAARIASAFETPFILDGHVCDVGVSIGIALLPDHGEDVEAVLRCADAAMYQAKSDGGGFRLHQPRAAALDELDRGALMAGLREAMEQGQLQLLYQPCVELGTGAPAGVEALLRWRHPKLGLLTPDRFLPLAERTGLIKPLTHWVLNEALRQCRDWQRQDIATRVAVNVSARNLQDAQLPQTIARLLRTYGLPSQVLTLEITESAILEEKGVDVIMRLADLGVRLSIDDFGAGYSSLTQLKRLPVSEIKIDRSFVAGAASHDQDALIVKSSVELAHQLGLRVVAEGIETRQAQLKLQQFGCDAGQGFEIGAPLPAERLADWLRQNAAPAEACDWRPVPAVRAPLAVASDGPPGELAVLRRIALFQLLEDAELRDIASLARRRSIAAGGAIFRKEDSGYTLYLIASGAVKISDRSPRGSEIPLGVLRAGDFFGELALFDDQPRSADATALVDTELLALSRDDVLPLLSRRPAVAVHMLRTLCQRLQDADESLPYLSPEQPKGRDCDD
jgi:diguanylate cyclase (GGDEF)-like protein